MLPTSLVSREALVVIISPLSYCLRMSTQVPWEMRGLVSAILIYLQGEGPNHELPSKIFRRIWQSPVSTEKESKATFFTDLLRQVEKIHPKDPSTASLFLFKLLEKMDAAKEQWRRLRSLYWFWEPKQEKNTWMGAATKEVSGWTRLIQVTKE